MESGSAITKEEILCLVWGSFCAWAWSFESDTWSGPKTHIHAGPNMGAKNGCEVGVDVGSSDCDANASRRFSMDVRANVLQARVESGSLSVGR